MKQYCGLAIIFFALPFTGYTQQTNSLEAVRQSFQKQEQALLSGYDQALGLLIADLKRKGDLEPYLTVEAEKIRFSTNRVVLLPSEAKPAFCTHVSNYFKAEIALLKKHILTLDALVRAEMKADRIANAKEVKEEKDRIAFILADLEAKVPQEPENRTAANVAKSANPVRLDSSQFVIKQKTGRAANQQVSLKDGDGLWNLSLLNKAKANASSLIPGFSAKHRIENLNDGWYDNDASWVASETPAWAEIDLAVPPVSWTVN